LKTNFSQLTQQFEAHDIPPNTFRHIDHISVAYEMLHKYSFLTTSTKYAEAVKSMAIKAGEPQKFNLTITLAFLSIIAERVHTTEHNNFEEYIARNEDLMDRKVLEKWYSTERLQSDLARTQFLLPICSD
jgi:hypothetical protein